jgi:hypothetical protein
MKTYSVEVKSIGLSWPDSRPFIYHWGSGHSFGTDTVVEALERVQKHLPNTLARERGGVLIEISRFCRVCNVSGVKPGCKRKKCPACAGRGTVERFGFPILNAGVEA